MQKPITDLPIKAICATTTGATASTSVVIIESYYSNDLDNGNTNRWYRKYSDGRIEQGGYATNLVIDSVVHCNFETPFTDASTIAVFITPHSTGAGSSILDIYNVVTDCATSSEVQLLISGILHWAVSGNTLTLYNNNNTSLGTYTLTRDSSGNITSVTPNA